jgi:hypothetical protein
MATGTLGSAARDYHTRQTCYLAKQIYPQNFAVTTAQSLKLGTVPAGSVIKAAGVGVSTAFNSATLNHIGIGTTLNGTQLAAVQTGGAVLGLTTFTLTTGSAQVAAADVDVYATNGFTGTLATAGTGVVWVEYIVP